MSAVAVVVRGDGAGIVADRRTVLGERTAGVGTAPMGPDAAKMGVTAGGCVWALAGHAAVPGVDLRQLIAANTATDPAKAAQDVVLAFDAHSERVRKGVWDETGFPVPELFDRAHTVAVVAGPVGSGVMVYQVGLMVTGASQLMLLGEGAIKVLAPPPLCSDLPAELEPTLSHGSLDDTVVTVAAAVRRAARSMPDLVSLELDAFVLRTGRSSPERIDVPVPTSPSV